MYKVILISGDRNWNQLTLFRAAMDKWVAKHGMPEIIIEGCARGADSFAEQWALENGVLLRHFPAQWNTLGRSAGPLRNIQMLKEGQPEAVIAFHHNLAQSKGTAHMVRIARAVGTPVWVPFAQPQQNLGL